MEAGKGGLTNGVTEKEPTPHLLREIIPPSPLHGERHRGTILRFQNDQKGVPSCAARNPPEACGFTGQCRTGSSHRSRSAPGIEAPTGARMPPCPSRRRPAAPQPGSVPPFPPKHQLSGAFAAFQLTLRRICCARRCSRSDTKESRRKLPESSARKRINSGIKIRNKVSRKCVGSFPGRRNASAAVRAGEEPSRVWRKVIGGCCQ